ncbi:hypothetical protein CORC01_06276 [Colletotrichum orchidophilum]|uniref:MOSC domain-containing protein n=1 Tax=Colletotrichum orchidophilum TaxID=1209926 RepID=A0A1G4BAX2_9PEZI|nr:uncharacterized protein CORC01_06276 [Colletotrichum orchidophilum]OHE98485.1 hypothetical protein CORC01_06276 [Colletotrichum orchidophilum]
MDLATNKTWAEVQMTPNPLTTMSTAITLVACSIVALVVSIRLVRFPQPTSEPLEISQLHIYPIKGLRGCALQRAHVGKYGLVGDRTFSLQKVLRDENDPAKKTYETMFIGYYLQMALFQSSVNLGGREENATKGEVVVKWHGRGTEHGKSVNEANITTTDEIRFALSPSTEGRKVIETTLHASRAKAYDMGDELAAWFSARLGFEARLVYIGDGSRPVLGSMAPNSRAGLRKARLAQRLRSFVPFFRFPEERLVFNDLAHYLVVTEESTAEVSSRLDGDLTMDVCKFRPNVVVKGASGPFVEDFWGELTFDGGVQMPLTANCYRCQSITVDYETGKTSTDDRGLVWKKLNKDRRVDKGAKYSPVFGRYGYCFGSAVGETLSVGQRARISHINPTRTTFDWPHLTTFGVSQKKK